MLSVWLKLVRLKLLIPNCFRLRKKLIGFLSHGIEILGRSFLYGKLQWALFTCVCLIQPSKEVIESCFVFYRSIQKMN